MRYAVINDHTARGIKMNINVSGEMDASGAVASPGSTVSAPFVLAFVKNQIQ